MSKATNSLEPLGEKRLAGKINLSVGAASKQLEAWQSWESNDMQNYGEYLYGDKATPVARSEAISDRLRNPRTSLSLFVTLCSNLQLSLAAWIQSPRVS